MKQISLTDEQFDELLTFVQCEKVEVLERINDLNSIDERELATAWHDELDVIQRVLNSIQDCK